MSRTRAGVVIAVGLLALLAVGPPAWAFAEPGPATLNNTTVPPELKAAANETYSGFKKIIRGMEDWRQALVYALTWVIRKVTGRRPDQGVMTFLTYAVIVLGLLSLLRKLLGVDIRNLLLIALGIALLWYAPDWVPKVVSFLKWVGGKVWGLIEEVILSRLGIG